VYKVDGFFDKNKDAGAEDFVELLASSSNTVVKELFAADSLSSNEQGSLAQGKQSKKTVAASFRARLTDLVDTLNAA
jgi:myosin heavy subunit